MNTYKSPSSIFINVSLGNKKSRPIQFEAKTNGESTFSTSEKKLIEAIEKHPWFNKLFIKTVSEVDENAGNVPDSEKTEGAQVEDENAENVTDSEKTEGAQVEDENAENVTDSGKTEGAQVEDENAGNVPDSGKTEGNNEDGPLKFTSLNDLKDYLLSKYPDELTGTKLNSKPKIFAFINAKQLNIVLE